MGAIAAARESGDPQLRERGLLEYLGLKYQALDSVSSTFGGIPRIIFKLYKQITSFCLAHYQQVSSVFLVLMRSYLRSTKIIQEKIAAPITQEYFNIHGTE